MVSKPEYSTSLTLRGPSSVVSRHPHSFSHSSRSRAKRYNRSHAGGTSYIPQNEFPVFSNSGDVEIVIKAGGHENRYLLHRHTLTRCSGFFEASTSLEWSRGAAAAAAADSTQDDLNRIAEESDGGAHASAAAGGGELVPRKRRWRYELDPGYEDGDVPMLVQKEADAPLDTNGIMPNGTGSLFGGPVNGNAGTPKTKSGGHNHSSSTSSTRGGFFRSVANLSLVPNTPTPADQHHLSQADQDLLRDYDNLFRIFYNYPPLLDGVNIADAYVQCKSLLTLADQYDALVVVGPRVDHHLLQFQSRLWKQIAKYPISYLRLGYLARSKVIFQEALIHVVGQWPAGERSLRAALPDSVIEIIEDKVDELEENVTRVESRLFRLNLCTPRGERITPAASFLDWLAVSFFRQWLADNTSCPPSPPSDNTINNRHGDRGHNRNGNTSDGSSRSANSNPGAIVQAGSASSSSSSTPPLPLASLGRTFRTLGSANPSAYLSHDECKRFLKLSPELYSRDNLRRFEKRIEELKAMARDIVRPLMGSGLELEFGGRVAEGLGYLTCTTVRERDLPWLVE